MEEGWGNCCDNGRCSGVFCLMDFKNYAVNKEKF